MRLTVPSRRGFLAGAAATLFAPRLWATERPVILILTSDETERTLTIASRFKKACDFAVRMSYLVGNESDAGAFIADNIRGQPVACVFAVGAAATRVAIREFAASPVIFAEVPPDGAPTSGPNLYPITTRLDPTPTLERLLKLLPGMKEVGLLCKSSTETYWPAAAEAAKALGLRATVRQVQEPDEVPNAFMALTGPTELVWLQQEPRIWTGGALSRVFHEATIQRFPLVGFARAHLDSPNPPPVVACGHPEGIGDLASRLARSIVLGEAAPTELGVAPMLIGHARAMRAAGFVVSAKSTEVLDELVGR
jgi:hypothetical protein